MNRTDLTNDLAFDLFAEWEDRRAAGEPVSLEEVCAAYHPDVLAEVRDIARRLADLPGLRPASGGTYGGAGAPRGRDGAEPPGDEGWERVGRGASSVVYRGHDPDFGTTVAYKVLHPRDELLGAGELLRLMQRFEQEARILARLKHEAIVR